MGKLRTHFQHLGYCVEHAREIPAQAAAIDLAVVDAALESRWLQSALNASMAHLLLVNAERPLEQLPLHTVTADASSSLPKVRLDRDDLQQILLNLLLNARDALDGSGRIRVKLGRYSATGRECALCHARLEGEWLALSIEDDGSGIEPRHLGRIFDPFFTTKEVGKGAGLGLAVAQSVVEHSGGHILVDTEVGAGTRFRLLFPPLSS
jgi:signal transduction histidine kinase